MRHLSRVIGLFAIAVTAASVLAVSRARSTADVDVPVKDTDVATGSEPLSVRPPATFGSEAEIWLSGRSLRSMLSGRSEPVAWKPEVSKARGGEDLFEKVAPAVAVVRTAFGHGTGIVISPEGRIVTNYHVIEEGSWVDGKKGVSTAMVHLGKFADGEMEIISEPLVADIIKADEGRDLALLQLRSLPPGMKALPYLKVSAQHAKVGNDCAIVGNPASGLLWTYRSGEVAALGKMPDDMIDVVVPMLAAAKDERAVIKKQLDSEPRRKIIVTSCGANSGDSGGPLVNKEGELIGVTFAIPTDAHARFSYHLHADELRGFLAEPGEKPLLLVPDAWDIGPRVQLVDVLHEGRAQALVAGEERPEQILLDVAGATPRDALRNGNLEALVGNREFRAQVALHLTPWERAAFYDSTGRGQFDLILVAKREGDEAGLEYRRQADGTWTVRENPGRKWLDGSNLADPRLGRRLRSLLAAF